jgi:hypothetical protein
MGAATLTAAVAPATGSTFSARVRGNQVPGTTANPKPTHVIAVTSDGVGKSLPVAVP